MSRIQSGDLATWVTGGVTAAAVITAWISSGVQWRQEKKHLRREQAERVAGWIAADKIPLPVKLANQSGDPVYDLIVSVVLVQGAGPNEGKESQLQHMFKVLPPGNHLDIFPDHYGGGMHTKPGIELAFTDKSGNHWLKDKNGRLTELKQSPAQYYGLTLPIGWLYFDDNE